MKHAGEQGDHQVDLHGVVVLGQVSVLGNTRKIQVVGCISGKHRVSPTDVELESGYGQSRVVDTGQK